MAKRTTKKRKYGKKKPNILLWFLGFCIAVTVLRYAWPLLLAILVAFIGLWIYETAYFRGQAFASIKERISSYIADCNDLNRYIESLKSTALVDNRIDYGDATYRDTSVWNVKRPKLESNIETYEHRCSSQVCQGAQKEPFKYICKYFNIPVTEESLSEFESILNNFETVEEGKESLMAEHDAIIMSVKSDVPALIYKLAGKRIESELGFDAIDFSPVDYPSYVFRYTSSGGNTGTECRTVMDIDMLNRFVVYLAERVKFSKSAAGQRALMTSRLRQHIKERDDFTCQSCGVSVSQEPHLLLEIDHIIPIAKGGLTTEGNLQTLCWRCNRSKGAKIQ